MDDPPCSSTTNFYNVLGITKGASIKEICMAYKSLVMKWHPDRNPANKAEAEVKFQKINEAFMALSDRDHEEKLLSINGPTTPSPSHGDSHHHHHRSSDDHFFLKPSVLLKSLSRGSWTPSKSPRRLRKNSGSPTKSRRSTTPTPDRTRYKSAYRRSPTLESNGPNFLRSMSHSKASPTPILYSQTIARRRPSPIEKKLECTLEELCLGCVKNVKITRDVIKNGIIEQEQEMLQIIVNPGWKKGTKITFEGKGDERPGYLPADITFLIDEKEHPLFRRDGDDLSFGVQIPLIDALTGCTILVPLLGGESTDLTFTEILYPGCEKVIEGQGMPKTKDGGRRGDLKIKFLVEFPTELSDEQRSSIVDILRDCN